MWFADLDVRLGWALLALWLVVALIVAARRGPRRAFSGRGLVLFLGSGVTAALWAAQATVVDSVADTLGAGPLDRSVWSWFVGHRTGAATSAMRAVSTVGGPAGMTVLTVLGVVVLCCLRRPLTAGILASAGLGGALLVSGFKHLYSRARPPLDARLVTESNFSLPSGHALGSVVVLGVMAAAAVLIARRPAVRVASVVLALFGTAAIGVSRLYLGVHWASDVLAGWLLGGAWLAVCSTVLVLAGSRPGSSRPAGTAHGAVDATAAG